ncbi:hypothetical protein [Sphingobium ummariense]
MSELHSSRRDVMRALAILPATIATPAVAGAAINAQTLVCATYDPIPEYLAASLAFDEDNAATVERHEAAFKALLEWEPTTAPDMLRKIVARLDDHYRAPEASLQLLIRQVDRLVEGMA